MRLLVEALGLSGEERAALVAAAQRRPTPHVLPTTPRRGTGDLPAPLTPFVGRAGEVAAVCALLQRHDVRLLTLTGPGGVGKTRLALHVAQELGGDFTDGVRFIDLAAIREPALVVPTVAQTLGLREMGGRPLAERLAAMLKDRRLLLVLDNIEQVVEAAPQVANLLAVCPRLTVLVTSRAVLRVSGERAFPVPPLALPDTDHAPSFEQITASEAVRLFFDRAQAASPGFALVEANAPTVAAICRRLDGLPLAIALAAARVAHLPLTALLMRLEQRLPLLTGGPRDQPVRLQTMREAIAWSHDLLSPDDQRLFWRLAVFAGGCTLEAAEYVGGGGGDTKGVKGVPLRSEGEGVRSVRAPSPPPPPTPPERSDPPAVLDGLASLVDKSLVSQDARADEPRYRMLETIREYGLEQLTASGEAGMVRRRLAEWCLTLGAQAHAELPGPDQRKWLERLEAEHDNIRSALSWLLEHGDSDAAQRLTATVSRFWYVRGHLSEGRTWVERALAGSLPTPAAVRAGALLAAGWLTWAQGDYAQAVERVQDSLSAFRALDHASEVAEGLYILGMVAAGRGNYDEATVQLTEALGLFRALGETQWVGFVLNAVGVVTYEQGDAERATSFFMEALDQFRAVGETNGTAYALTNLGKMALAAGDFTQAAASFRARLALRREYGEQASIAGCLRGLAIIGSASGRFEEAARLFGAAEALRETIGLPAPRHHERYEQAVSICRTALGDDQLLALWHSGRELPLETVLATAMAIDAPIVTGPTA